MKFLFITTIFQYYKNLNEFSKEKLLLLQNNYCEYLTLIFKLIEENT